MYNSIDIEDALYGEIYESVIRLWINSDDPDFIPASSDDFNKK